MKIRIRNGGKIYGKTIKHGFDAVDSGLGEKIIEKAIFDKSTGKLDLYVPLCLEDGCVDDAREFLQTGGQYIKFALKEFMKELLFELIKPVGEWTYVAEKTNDEVLECQSNDDCEQGSAYFFPDQTTEICRIAEYVYDNIDRFTQMAEEKALEV